MDEEISIQRRLAAILAADIAGYSRLSGSDWMRISSGSNACRTIFGISLRCSA